MLTKEPESRARRRLKSVGAVVDGAEADGMPGLVKTVFRMIGENQPSIDCIREADNAFESASDAEQFWDAALDMAACLRNAELEPEPPDPPEPPPDHPDPPPPPPFDWRDNVADVVLAGLLVRLYKEGGAKRGA